MANVRLSLVEFLSVYCRTCADIAALPGSVICLRHLHLVLASSAALDRRAAAALELAV